jgi:hypothetical protein
VLFRARGLVTSVICHKPGIDEDFCRKIILKKQNGKNLDVNATCV